jgi:molecular chaperone DnaK (HSP70)
MALRLAVDFGTATTCVATVPDLQTFQPKVLPIDGENTVVSTAVFLDRAVRTAPLVQSRSSVGRHPLGVFSAAYDLFDAYWAQRRLARTDGVAWGDWERSNREEAMLLTHFKPELSDNPVRVPLRVPRIIWGSWDGLAQSQDYAIVFDERSVSTPDPDTDDLVAATASVLRFSVERALESSPPGERISHLAIGVPSLSGDSSSDELDRASQRRREAVDLARIKEDYGTSDFQVLLHGEAEAAAWSIDIDSERQVVYKVIIDVGAGTTDLALIEYERERPGIYRVGRCVMSKSIRFAGRDMNLALAMVLRDSLEFRRGIEALDQTDKRAWQNLMYGEVERIKCNLSTQATRHSVDFGMASAHMWGTAEMDRIAHALRCTAIMSLSSTDPRVKGIARAALRKEWLPTVSDFIAQCIAHVGDKRELLSVEKVGGAFRFAPLNAELITALQQQSLPITNLRFRDDAGRAQTMVARGLARWVAQDR